MMKDKFGMPGPGGSLGECALCGENFLKEVITNSTVKSITVAGCDIELFAHDKCFTEYQGKDFKDLPENSSLRRAYERATAKEAG